jgi:hypothetical protein
MTAAGLVLESGAQGIMFLDGSLNSSTSPTATSSGLVFFKTTGAPVLDNATDINVELAYGTTAGNVSLANAVTTLLLSSSQYVGNGALGETLSGTGDIMTFHGGKIYDVVGSGSGGYVFPTLAPGIRVYLEVFAWTGNFSSYAAAETSGTALAGASGVFYENLAGTSRNYIDNMPALVLTQSVAPVPEPAPLAMFSLGGLALFGFRRWKCKSVELKPKP